jgi:uncharacterized protein
MNQIDPVVHFEMPYQDKKRMSEFYTQCFGWKEKVLGPEMGDYVLVNTTETDAKGFPKDAGKINGGFWPKDKSKPAQYPNIVIAVENIQESMRKVRESGGKIIGEPAEIPGNGTYICFYDTEGNRVAMIQPLPM